MSEKPLLFAPDSHDFHPKQAAKRRIRLNFTKRTMDIGSAEFNFVRTLMVAGTGGAEISECFAVADRTERNNQESRVREWAAAAGRAEALAESAVGAEQMVSARHA
jgi:vancomycin permeability regulator SanA